MSQVVPFRLTQDIVDGFGANGVEGAMRRCCEATLQVRPTCNSPDASECHCGEVPHPAAPSVCAAVVDHVQACVGTAHHACCLLAFVNC